MRRRPGSFPVGSGPQVVAMGGGHGLAASLRALRRVTDNLTAIVGVADDGGSSGRLRAQFGVPPPGDLRMALAALCGDDLWGNTWSRVVQHRFGGDGELRGHPLGNLLITALWEETGDVVTGLDWVGALLGAQGRVLPVALCPLEIYADVQGLDRDSDAPRRVRGQVAVAKTEGRVVGVGITPAEPPVCPEAIEALTSADHIVLGPGSWYTSVMAPLLGPRIRRAFAESQAKKSLVLNLVPQPGETSGFEPHTHLEVWQARFPHLRLDYVYADRDGVPDPAALERAAAAVGAELLIGRLALQTAEGPTDIHDPDRLAAVFADVIRRGSIAPWR